MLVDQSKNRFHQSGSDAKRGPTARVTDPSADWLPGDRRLDAHLRAWLGDWRPRGGIDVLVWPGRDRPGWNGETILGLGVESPHGTVLSLSPRLLATPIVDPRSIAVALRSPGAAIEVPALLRRPDLILARAVFRWSEAPASLPEIGEWMNRDEPRLPVWLRPFNGGALVAWDAEGRYAAGVGIKRHNSHAHEIAVQTDPAHRGRGMARLLVAQAARRIIASGALPLYLHEAHNAASAKVAAAAGFPDRGWRVLGLYPAPVNAPGEIEDAA